LPGQIAARAGGGRALEEPAQAMAVERYGIDSSEVRIHDDTVAAELAEGFQANALTVGNDIFFGAGRYAPGTAEGDRVLAHELAHVAQQGGQPRAVQCDGIVETREVDLGFFDIDMEIQPPTTGPDEKSGVMGTIEFTPKADGPYSAEIGLVQAVKVTDVAGTTSGTPGSPVDWSNIAPGGANPDAGRNELQTEGRGVAPEGWMIDARTAGARGTNVGPNYIEQYGTDEPYTQFGYLRSPTDRRPASLWDYPGAGEDYELDFDFETVPKGTDNQTVYGSLQWGFGMRLGAVLPGSDYVYAENAASDTFEEALERFRGFFVHEPVVLYFDTNIDKPIAGEDGKLADVLDYLDRYPDVRLSIEGWADRRGSEADNADLAQRRADSVQRILLRMGVDASRINYSAGVGETEMFSSHGSPSASRQETEPGLLKANRRVVVRFEHTVTDHPIMMP
jgi:outer membrane protein OmpA-like peptidoglycan-associated protein